MTLPTADTSQPTADEPPAAAASAGPGEVLRVERGAADPEELAAVTAVLLARAAAQSAPSCADRPKVGWRRLERETGFRAPHSWRV